MRRVDSSSWTSSLFKCLANRDLLPNYNSARRRAVYTEPIPGNMRSGQYASRVSSIHSHDAEDMVNEHPQIESDPVENITTQARNRVDQIRPNDLDSLQEIPSDWEDGDSATPSYSNGRLPKSWQPLWLRRPILITMSATLVTLAAAVVVLHIISTRNQGLGSTSSTDSIVYIWEYLPTTVMVALLAVWNGIDFSTRLLQPWANLRNGPKIARDTLLLDLLTPILPVMAWTASKAKAWPSLSTITAGILLNITASPTLRILSTSLLQVETVPVNKPDFPLVKASSFNVSSFNAWTASFPKLPDIDGYTAVAVYYGLLTQGLPWPEWTFDNATLEPLLPNSEAVGRLSPVSYKATTRGFFPRLECEEAEVHISGNYRSQPVNITFKAPSCETELTKLTLTKEDYNKVYTTDFHIVNCSDQTQKSLSSVILVDSTSNLFQSSALFCSPSSSVKNISVQVDFPEGHPNVDWGSAFEIETAEVGSINPTNLFWKMINSLASLSKLLPLQKDFNGTYVESDGLLWAASISLLGDVGDANYVEPFLNTTVMERHIRSAFCRLATIMAKQHMLGTAQEQTQGVSTHNEVRVQTAPGTAYAMGSLLLLCALLSFLLQGQRPHDSVPRDPRGIGGIGIILHNSGELQRLYQLGLPQFENLIQNARFFSHVVFGPRSKFLVSVDHQFEKGKRDGSTDISNKRQRSWQPIVLTAWCRLLAIVLPLLGIAALEYTQRVSDTSTGFATISRDTSAHYAATLIPVTAMWAVGALYASINFNVLLLSPYQAMARAKGFPGILSHNLGRLPIASLFASIRDGHTAACFSAIGTILGSFLTIVVAGLYSYTTLDFDTSLTVQRTDSLGVSWGEQDMYGDKGTGLVVSLVVWQNLSYPQWTHDDLVLPKLALNEADYAKSAGSPARIAVSVPARRAVLECNVNNPEQVTVRVRERTEPHGAHVVKHEFYNISTEYPSRCPGSPKTKIPITLSLDGETNGIHRDSTGFVGGLFYMWETTTTIIVDPGKYRAVPNAPGCHSLFFYYGSLPSKLPESSSSSPVDANITTLACTQLVQEVDVTLSLTLTPGGGGALTLDPSRPPAPRRVDGAEYWVSFPLREYLHTLGTDPDVQKRLEDLRSLEPFYQGVVMAADGGMDPGGLAGRENADRLVEATGKMYGRYMAQAMHRVMRKDEPPPPSQRTLPATITQSRTRLRQNAGPKAALQVLLGLMSACVVGTWLAMPNTKFLPHEPGSIAGVATLIAGGGMWDDDGDSSNDQDDATTVLPDGAEWMDDEELKKAWDGEGISFGFGARADGSVGVNTIRRRKALETGHSRQVADVDG
ncbi:hypothetical protein PG999_000310 [Apiospora kogelbergensis]|uniref:Uncharacterized protein n=1 Tax=Apiospora kogelbergensis TaxID=1337665 RepID=A0AAW0RB40_9PEZI